MAERHRRLLARGVMVTVAFALIATTRGTGEPVVGTASDRVPGAVRTHWTIELNPIAGAQSSRVALTLQASSDCNPGGTLSIIPDNPSVAPRTIPLANVFSDGATCEPSATDAGVVTPGPQQNVLFVHEMPLGAHAGTGATTIGFTIATQPSDVDAQLFLLLTASAFPKLGDDGLCSDAPHIDAGGTLTLFPDS